MADFNSDLQSLKPSFPYLDNIDPNTELMNQFAVLHPSLVEASNMNLQSLLGFSYENFFNPQQQVAEFPGNLLENFPGMFQQDVKNVTPIPLPLQSADHIENEIGNCFQVEDKKRKAMDISECSSGNSSTPPGSESSGIKRKISSGKGKRIKGNDKEKGMPKEVVHVRARRGQATDSHSLAERVRRGKINERLRCLQDIVPGCYKTMGMAVMLDEIINYVQSLQNQVEFLSMKLTAASSFYDFNSETDAIEALQMAKANEALKVQRVMRGGYEQVGPLDLTFGTYPSLPYNSS